MGVGTYVLHLAKNRPLTYRTHSRPYQFVHRECFKTPMVYLPGQRMFRQITRSKSLGTVFWLMTQETKMMSKVACTKFCRLSGKKRRKLLRQRPVGFWVCAPS